MKHFTLTTPLAIFISLAAIAGVSLHDTKLDRLASAVIGAPAVMFTADAGLRSVRGDDHTHVERVSFKEVTNQSPRLMPRYGEQKKYMLQKSVPRGQHFFDGYSLPIASLRQ